MDRCTKCNCEEFEESVMDCGCCTEFVCVNCGSLVGIELSRHRGGQDA